MAIDHANLASLDLNLLVAFDALLAEGSVTRAAARVGIGQSAMSHNLARLRALFGDELLTRTPDGMQPTPRAAALRERVRQSLSQIQAIVAPADSFAPASADRAFRIGLPDSMEVLLIPPLLAYLCVAAPGIRLRLQATADPSDILDDLDADRIDIAIGVGPLPPGRTHHKRRQIMTATFVCLFSGEHVPVAPPISLQDYVRFPHVLTSVRRGERGVVDDALEKLGLTRTIAVITPRFLAVPYLVRSAPLITTMHAALARRFAHVLNLRLSPPPVELPEMPISLLWHASYDHDLAHLWLRQTLVRLAAETTKNDE